MISVARQADHGVDLPFPVCNIMLTQIDRAGHLAADIMGTPGFAHKPIKQPT